jgi:hypothetical protein
MNDAYVSALAALAGSVVGAVGSIATTWLTSNAQERARGFSQEMSRRENLYGEFIEEAAKVYAHALRNELDDVSNLVHLYALASKLRLFASAGVISKADDAMRRIVETYQGPNRGLPVPFSEQDAHQIDVLRAFSEACRKEMVV